MPIPNSPSSQPDLADENLDAAAVSPGPPTALTLRAHDPQPEIRILRHRYRGDPHLPDLELEIEWAESA